MAHDLRDASAMERTRIGTTRAALGIAMGIVMSLAGGAALAQDVDEAADDVEAPEDERDTAIPSMTRFELRSPLAGLQLRDVGLARVPPLHAPGRAPEPRSSRGMSAGDTAALVVAVLVGVSLVIGIVVVAANGSGSRIGGSTDLGFSRGFRW